MGLTWGGGHAAGRVRQRGVEPEFSGVMVPAGIGGEGGGIVGVGEFEAAGKELALGEGADAAAAVEAFGRLVGFPDGIVGAVDFAVHGAVHGAGAGVDDGDVLSVGAGGGGFGLGLVASGAEGDGDVGVDDGADAVGRTEEDFAFGAVGPGAFFHAHQPAERSLASRVLAIRARDWPSAMPASMILRVSLSRSNLDIWATVKARAWAWAATSVQSPEMR